MFAQATAIKHNTNPTNQAPKSLQVNLRYPGQYFDVESGLHYNWHRSYDQHTGRYTQVDPIGLNGGWNRFGYVGGNALGAVDPMGLYFGLSTSEATGIVTFPLSSIGWRWGDPIPAALVNACAGFGDGASLGTTVGIRELMGTNDAVDFSSPEYWGGVAAGVAVTAKGYSSGAELSIGRNVRIAPWGNRTGHPTGRYPHYHRRGAPDTKGNTPPGQGIGRHRPWDTRSTDKCGCDRF